MKEYAKQFYKSTAWQKCREGFIQERHGLCEVCLSRGLYVPGEIVHHKVHITPGNIGDPEITLNYDNLQLVCRDCHADAHKKMVRRYGVDELGRVQIIDGTPP